MREMVLTEADTCREFVTPRLVEAGWGSAPYAIGEQRSFTNGRIIVSGGKVRSAKQKRADYLSHYRRDYPLQWSKPKISSFLKSDVANALRARNISRTEG